MIIEIIGLIASLITIVSAIIGVVKHFVNKKQTASARDKN